MSSVTSAEEQTQRVIMATSLGEIEIVVYPERAPISAGNFLAYVGQGLYEGAEFYRSATKSAGSSIAVVQGGLLGASMAGDGADYENPSSPLAPIAHESTHKTGIPNERGTMAYARLSPGTASSEFFFNTQDNPILDTDNGGPDRDGYGYATFGRVVRGMEVLDRIQQLPTDGATQIELVRGQILREPVLIESMRVVQAE